MTAGLYEAGDVRLAAHPPAALRAFNELGVLGPADIHVADRLTGLFGDPDPSVLLAAALTVRALRLGHVCVDLTTVRHTITTDLEGADLTALPWPQPDTWIEVLAASPLVAAGDAGFADRPLRLAYGQLYLDRYWRQECLVAADLQERSREDAPAVAVDVLGAGLERLFPSSPDQPAGPDLQRLAAAAAVLRRFAVVAGGPGTGKTTTVARILALLEEQAAARSDGSTRIALAAPTGKAAARLQEAVHHEARHLDTSHAIRERLVATRSSTLHRLLGWRPDSSSRFRHDRRNRLPHDTVIVDETSMLSLSLMAKLVEALRPDARLILVGDPQQLASVEAGAVLGDIVGPAERGLRIRPAFRHALAEVTGTEPDSSAPPEGVAVGDGIVVLQRVHRFGGAIAALADAIQVGDGSRAEALLRRPSPEIRWFDVDAGSAAGVDAVRADVVAAGRAVWEAATRGDGAQALAQLSTRRVLCAHRQGPVGVETWNDHIESWLRTGIPGYGSGAPSAGRWYVGRPLLVTANDYELQLYNGDTGVVVRSPAPGDERLVAVFERQGGIYEMNPGRLGAVETVHAMTVHKSQGSQFDSVVIVLPDPDSAILTRELLYTAVTRARRQVTLVGPAASLRAGVERPIARASGLRRRLWAPADPPA